MHAGRTQEWWLVRFELAVAVLLLVTIVLAGWHGWTNAPFSGYDPITLGPLSLPGRIVVVTVALALAVVGLIWMLRIFRPRQEEPPRWRYRDR